MCSGPCRISDRLRNTSMPMTFSSSWTGPRLPVTSRSIFRISRSVHSYSPGTRHSSAFPVLADSLSPNRMQSRSPGRVAPVRIHGRSPIPSRCRCGSRQGRTTTRGSHRSMPGYGSLHRPVRKQLRQKNTDLTRWFIRELKDIPGHHHL